MRLLRNSWFINALLVTFTLGAVMISHVGLRMLTQYKLEQSPYDPTLLKPEIVRILCLGYEQLAADIYWLRFVQYIGDSEARQGDKYGSAFDYLDLVTSLDPSFVQAYWFSTFVLGGDLGRPDLAQTLIERGIRANQNNWYLPFIAGINQYLFARNETEAAKYYRMAAKFPNAPKWLGRQAQILQANIPSLVKEVHTWDTIYRNTDDHLVKSQAKERLAATWMRVFKLSPSEEIRKRARKALMELGIEVR